VFEVLVSDVSSAEWLGVCAGGTDQIDGGRAGLRATDIGQFGQQLVGGTGFDGEDTAST
jgi:hypothetical protein